MPTGLIHVHVQIQLLTKTLYSSIKSEFNFLKDESGSENPCTTSLTGLNKSPKLKSEGEQPLPCSCG